MLVCYAIANANAWTLPGRQRGWPRPVAGLGLAGCLVLIATLPATSVLAGLAVLAVGVGGVGGRALVAWIRARTDRARQGR